jgi:putative redox protein
MNTMAHEIETQWMGKMQFNTLINGHTIVMDAPEKSGGEDQGPIPKPFILTALSGCTGMDVITLLRKQQITIDDFNIRVIGELSKTIPITYTSLHMVYEFKGDAVNEKEAIQAVQDSQEKYCGVSFLLKKALPVTWEIHYNQMLLFTNKPVSTIESA